MATIEIDINRKFIPEGYYTPSDITKLFPTLTIEPIPTDEELEAMYKQAAASETGEAIFDSEKGGVQWEISE